ncbi:MAG: DEAD/DEAH box helicase [Trueperella sp.]|nr:DEAD/DEAH box helicase [Trueperella sp.]
MDRIVANFVDSYAARGITLDDFQLAAIRALAADADVLVSAPTGAGKTVVAEFAVELALARSAQCIYTAPIKALSNQKYKDLAESWGAENVGLLTGDQTINRQAPILVVTTEVLRNMLFQRDGIIADVGYAVLDEVHYLADQFRGPVWEEIILQLPAHVRLVSLSATIANVAEFSQWLRAVRGRTEVVVSTDRPVPLVQQVAAKRQLIPLYDHNAELSAALARMDARAAANHDWRRRGVSPARRRKLIRQLAEQDMLPAIEFIFSRKGCDRAVADLLDAEVVLTTESENQAIYRQLQELRQTLTAADARAVRFNFWAKAMQRGYSAHHAGMFPALKELAENLMEQGLLKLVYATGTLALGIDMPVRTVVLEELRRWDGADFVDLTATEYTQLIGRAGRRGKDKVGNAVVLHTPDLDISALADLGSGRVEPLLSAFYPSYNTVVNLLANYSYAQARTIMGTSFAQFQNNAELGELEGKLSRIEARLEDSAAELATECARGELPEYLRLHSTAQRASKAERKRAKAEYQQKIRNSWRTAQTGHLYAYARNGELEYGVVLSVAEKKLRLVTWDARLAWLYADELSSELRDLGQITLPFGRSVKDSAVRDGIAADIFQEISPRIDLEIDRDLEGSWDRFAVRPNPQLEQHPVHNCPELPQHLAAGAEFLSLLARRTELQNTRDKFSESVAREFDATANVLRRIGYLQGEEYSLAGGAAILRRIHNEADLLICLCLSETQFAELTAAQFAGICSVFLCDRRLGTRQPHTPQLRGAWKAVLRNLSFLLEIEDDAGITRTAEPFVGGAEAFYAWASGADLETVLHQADLVVGDFISANRRLIDLLGQLAEAGAGFWLGETAAAARELVRRWEWV